MLQIITLHLARSSEFPTAGDRYDIVAPIDATGYLDSKEWTKLKGQCRVRRFRPEEGERHGMLLHRPGGASGAMWLIHYDALNRECEEKGVHFETHRFAEGEYISLRDASGRLNTFKIALMRPLVTNTGPATSAAADTAQPAA